MTISAPRDRRPDQRLSVLRKAQNLRRAIERAKADGNEGLRQIWERDLRAWCEAYRIEAHEL